MKVKKRKVFYYTGILVFAFLLALILVPLLFEDEIEELIKIELNERVNAEVDFEDIHLSLWKTFPNFSMEINELRISGKNQFRDYTLFYSEEIQLISSLSSIISRKDQIEILNFTINKAELNLLTDKNGEENYDIIKKTSPDQSADNFNLALNKYAFNHLDISWIDETSNSSGVLQKLHHSGKGDFTSAQFNLESISNFDTLLVFAAGIPIIESSIGQMNAVLKIDANKNQYSFQNTVLELDELGLEIAGDVIADPENFEINMTLKSLENNFQSLFSVLPGFAKNEDVSLKGKFDFQVTSSGRLDLNNEQIPKIDAFLTVSGAEIKYDKLDYPITNINLVSSIRSKSNQLNDLVLEVSKFNAQVENSQIKAEFLWQEIFSDPKFFLKSTANLDLNKWSQALPSPTFNDLQGFVWADIVVSGKQSDIELRKYNFIQLTGDLSGRDIRINTNQGENIIIPTLASDISPSKANITIISFQYGNSNADLKATIDYPMEAFFNSKPIVAQLEIKGGSVHSNDLISQSDTIQRQDAVISKQFFTRFMLGLKCTADEVYYENYKLEEFSFNGKLNKNQLEIEEMYLKIEDSDINISGQLYPIYEYSFLQDTLKGELYLSSNRIAVDDFMKKNMKAENANAVVPLPENLNIKINTDIDRMSFRALDIRKPKGQIWLRPDQLDLIEFTGNSMNGILKLDGIYNTQNLSQPVFSFKYDMSQIDYVEAVKAIPLINSLAPIVEYIDGQFNTSLVLKGDLNKELFPNLNSLTGQGLVETLNGNIKGFMPLEKLNQLFSISKIEEWTLKNTESWFEVEDGYVNLKDMELEWKGISFLVKGRHQLSGAMDYTINARVPRKMLRQNQITANADLGLQKILEQAKGLGINTNQGDYLDLEILMTGRINNPQLKLRPLGMSSGKDVTEAIEQTIEEKVDIMKDSIKTKTSQKIDTIKSKASEELGMIKDSVENTLKKNIDSLLFKAKRDSLLEKHKLDSLKRKAEELLKNKNQAEIDSIKSKLKTWNPFSKTKKKKNNL